MEKFLRRKVTIVFCLMLSYAFHLRADADWDTKKQEIIDEIKNYEGWCTASKAEVIADLIKREKPRLCVEIGTFGGATLSVIAKTLRYNGLGIVFSIDAWSNEEAIKNFPMESTFYQWWSKIDLGSIRKKLLLQLEKDQLKSVCCLKEMTSQAAATLFKDKTIDFLVIDGNHSEKGVFSDVLYYYPKVKNGGYILLNDANWFTMRKALIYLLENTDLCSSYYESAPFLLFKKNLATQKIADQLWR